MTAALSLNDADRSRVEQIAQLAREEAVGQLIGLLSEPSWAVRRAVVACLARIASAIDPLCAMLVTDRSDETRLAAAVEALVASSDEADEAVLGLLRARHPAAVLCDAAQILGRRKCRRAITPLALLIPGDDDNVAAAAIEALGRIRGAATVEPLIAAVSSRNFFRAFPAISPLGRSADPRAIPPLVSLLGEPLYAAAAAEALGHCGQLSAAGPLIALLVSTDDALVRAAAGGLARLRIHREARFDELLREATAAAPSAAAVRARLRGCASGGHASDRIALSIVLGCLRDDAAIAELVELFRAEVGDVEESRVALSALGASAEPRLLQAVAEGNSAERLRFLPLVKTRRAGLPVFVACLEDADPRVRAQACLALIGVGEVSAVPALFRLIGDTNAHVSQAAGAAIQALGCAETQALAMAAARSPDPRRRRAALRIIAYFGFPEALEVLTEAISDPDARIRDAAIYGLPFIEHPRAVSMLLDAGDSPAPSTRAAAMRAMGKSTREGAVTTKLVRGLRDTDPWVRYYACQALGRLECSEALDDVIALIDDPAGQVRVAAIEAVAKLTDGRATDVLDAACRSADPDIRRAAILGLAGCNSPDALPILLREVRSEDAATRLYALSALAEMGSDDATEALAGCTLDSDPAVKSAAIGVLSRRAGERATRWLIARLQDAQGGSEALAALQNPVAGRIEAILMELVSAEPPLSPLLVTALARMRSPKAPAALEAAFGFDNVHARRSAALALVALDSAESRTALDQAKRHDPDDEVRRICTAARP